jgi:predicted enzyme related to lactoylglutathione lyase
MAPKLANGKICYLEIPTADVAQSIKFYQAVFGWATRRRGDGATAFDDGVEVSGTWVTGRPSSPTPGLLIYVMVANLPATVDAITANGGRMVPTGIQGPEVTAQFADPDGNVLGLYQDPGLSSGS